MKKILTIGWKDLVVIFRDRSALILMLGAPFVLTIGLGLVTGAFNDSDTGTGLADIPLAIVDLDNGDISTALIDTLNSEDLDTLLQPTAVADTAVARQMVEDDEIAAAVIIPAGFTNSIIPQDMATGATSTAVAIEIYANPARPISAGVINSIVQGFVNRVETGMVSVQVTMARLVMSGAAPLNDTAELSRLGQEIGERQITALDDSADSLIEIRQDTAVAEDEPDFNTLAYFAPGMAVLFLLYTVTLGARSLLDERQEGTLARLMASPTTSAQILGGKILGIFLSGVAQVGVLVLGSTMLFGLSWGDPLGVLLLILAVALAATGYGLLLASAAKNASQISNFGSALMLVFGLIGGSFTALPNSPFMNAVSRITPNAWALDGFVDLHLGGGLGDIITELLALVIMGAILFTIAAAIFSRRREAILG